MFDESREGHIPYGNTWTDEDRRKFAVYTDTCPTCLYKFQYAELIQFLQQLSAMEDLGVDRDDPQYISLAEGVSRRQMELNELGLMLAAEQCGRNVIVMQALAN